MSEAKFLTEKIQRFGLHGSVLSGGFNSMETLKYAQARVETAERDKVEKSIQREQTHGKCMLPPMDAEKVKRGEITRTEILAILAETVRVQSIVQQEVSELARAIVKEKKEGDKKKRKIPLSFVEGHKKILELNLPKEPTEDFGLSEAELQKILMGYEEDEEVMTAAQRLLHPAGKGDQQRALGISMEQIVEIHQFMVVEMQKVLQEFLQMPQDQRRSYTGKGCETTAELLVSIAVEQQMAVRCEDVEQAVIMYEEQLATLPEFTWCTEQLATMMQHMIGAAQPRVEVGDFLKVLRHMGESSKKAKVFAKQLYEDYRAKKCDIVEAYSRFENFSAEGGKESRDAQLLELSPVEMSLCYEEYKNLPEVKEAWTESGADSSMFLQALSLGVGPAPPSPATATKGKKLKASEIVEMQELMVDELKRTSEAVAAASSSGKMKDRPWQAELAVQLVQALASAAVERRYGTSAEEMTMAGFSNAAVLQRNERFVRATEMQQDYLMRIPPLCGQPPST